MEPSEKQEAAVPQGRYYPAPPPAPGPSKSPLRVLRHREFTLFWVGQSISLVGMWMQAFAQGWVVTNLTTSAFALGLLNFANSIPTLVLMPFGGVAADRFERRRILLWTQWILLVLALVIGALIALDRLQLWHLWVIALLLGVAMAFELPAFQSFYPQLVEREELSQAIALNQAAFHGSRIIGPMAAALVVRLWGTAAAFFANAASFLAVILSLSLIRPRPPAVSTVAASAGGMMREGFRYVRERPGLQALLGITGVNTLFIFPNLAVLMPFYARHVLRVGEDGLAWLMAMSGTGALLGSALLMTILPERRLARITLSAGTILVTMSVLAWSRSLWLSAAVVAFQSMAISTSLGLASIIVQEMVPDELRGRVMSLYTLMFTGVMPFAALLIPSVVDWIGMRLELQIAAVLYAIGMLLLLWRLKHAREAPEAAEQEPAVSHTA
jgi:MFS family permease